MIIKIILYTLSALGAFFIIFVLFNLLQTPNGVVIVHSPQNISYSTLIKLNEKGEIKHATLSDNIITIKTSDNKFFRTRIINENDTVKQLITKGANVEILAKQEKSPTILEILISWSPLALLLLTIWISFSHPLGRIEQRLKSIEEKLFDHHTNG